MVKYNVGLNKTDRTVQVNKDGTALPSTHPSIGSFEHGNTVSGDYGDLNHVMYHHVQDLLYKQGITDMQSYPIHHDPG